MPDLKIGQVAARAGVGVDTIRYYERLGLLPPAARRATGYRVFDESTITRIEMIRRLQAMGLSLDAIGDMLRATGARATCEQESEHIRAALGRAEEQLAAITRVRDSLRDALERCSTGRCTIAQDVAMVARTSTSRRAG